MKQLKHINDAVYYAEDRIVCFQSKDVLFLKEQIEKTGLKRIRICAHKNIDDLLQEMIIAFTKDSYVRPSKHLDKEESIHVLEGEGSFVFFDETGEITFVVPVGGETSGRQMYVRTPKSTYHTLLIKSDRFIVHETTQGPFKREDTVFAKWAPEDGASIEVEKYLKELADRVEKFRISK